MLSRETTVLVKDYVKKFGNGPPLFGYDPNVISSEIRKALKTGEPMRGADELLADEGITGVLV